ncbi:hypothetical protein VB264_23760 [Arcicella aquatica]|uniref:Lipoprotein n=1 Tax=Arcicella aquatica TaxID=217141 RepID=A0ABU5QUQ6_9BACT|nr:hypothetical protein [Arcicella aquatica]MEA5260837.1 hypothetical protein [Arcicella aquatica]
MKILLFASIIICSNNSLTTKQLDPTIQLKTISLNDNVVDARDYSKILYPLLEKFWKEKRLSDEEIAKLIPMTDKEFSEYYSLSFVEKGKKWNKIYSDIELLIGKRACVSQQVCKAYLGLAPFVDGEYAEGYFEDADFIIGKHQKYFCKIFSSFPQNVRKRLNDLHSHYCK